MSFNNHILVSPIYNLRLSSEINKELFVEDVRLIDKDKLLRNIKRGGFPWSFSQLKKILIGKPQAKLKYQDIRNFFDSLQNMRANTFAIIKIAGSEDKHIIYGRDKIKDAIWILASNQLGMTKRGKVIRFGAPEYGTHILDKSLVVPSKIQESLYKSSIWVSSPIHEHVFGRNWKEEKEHHFLPEFLSIINKKYNIKNKWKVCLKKAAILSGKSAFLKDIAWAFLFNMVAIETLLKQHGEDYLQVMPNRINYLFGWIYKDENASFESINKITKHLYKLRNDFVHNGDVSNITIHDLIETDVILTNLLFNFCRLRKVFKDKETIIKLSKELEARRFLNIKLKRPKKLRFLRMQYFSRDYEQIEKKGI